MKRILITGAAGYLGTKLTELCLKHKDWEVTGVDNFYHNNSQTILPFLPNPRYNFIKADLIDADKITSLEPWNYDVVVHLAALVGFPICQDHEEYARSIILKSTKNLVNILNHKNSQTQIIYPTTNSGYGSQPEGIVCTEETPMRPISLYGVLKHEAEMELGAHNNHVSLRLATVFGSSYRLRNDLLVNSFTWKAYKDKYNIIFDGHAMRNYIHINDVCNAMIHCIIQSHKVRNQIFNIGNDSLNMSKLQLAQKINEFAPHQIVEGNVGTDPDKRNYIVSSAKFNATGFGCAYSIEYGIKELLKTYKAIDVPHNANY